MSDEGERAELATGARIRLADQLAETIAGMIQDGAILTGDPLPPERRLMQRFGVSRAVVREAIAALGDRGILHLRPGYRPVVQKPDASVAVERLGGLVRHLMADEVGVWNLFETRILIEAALVRHAAAHARPHDIAALQAALVDNRAAIGDAQRFHATDVAFHEIFYRIPGNPIYPAVQRAFVEWLQEHWERMPQNAEIDRMNHKAHQSILEAILRREADHAERMLRSHLTTAWEFVRVTFETC
jgi:GntR family transcriptional regulator, sialic acid-inducible nan operon repressor